MDTMSLFKEALHLHLSDRLRLIELLTRSLNKPDEDVEKIWAEEAEKRYKALEEGKLKTVPLKEIIERYR